MDGAAHVTAALEKSHLKIGIIPLTDCAVIAMAKERGFFEKHGLNVVLSKEPSWASLRDKIIIGDLDAAQMLAPMPIAMTLGVGIAAFPMVTAFSLGLNGNAITVSNALYEEMRAADPHSISVEPVSARSLHAVIAARKLSGRAPLTFATVFPFSLHNFMLRYWLAAPGIHPDRDLRLIVLPPPRMMAELEAGNIDGYCVGEPWNQVAVAAGIGRVLVSGYELWNNAPEKILGVSRAWADRHPQTHLALISALLEAAQWLDLSENRLIAAEILARPSYIGVAEDIIKGPLTGSYPYGAGDECRNTPDFNVFFRYAANFPWVSHGLWVLGQMYRWGHLTVPHNMISVARAIYRPDLYRQAAAALNIEVPTTDFKTEGTHSEAWRMDELTLGADKFFDDRRFDPGRPAADYLEGFGTHSLRLPLKAIDSAVNLVRP